LADDLPIDFKGIADAAPTLIWVSGRDKGGIWFNRTWLEYTGASLEEELGVGWLSHIHPEDLRAIDECADAFQNERPFRTEFRLRRHDGSYRWMIDVGNPRFGADGSFLGFVGSLTDIEERKQAEEELRLLNDTLESKVTERTRELADALEGAKAEAAERIAVEQAFRQAQKIQSLGQLTGGIAHDFNNLLTPILGGLELVLKMTKEEQLKPLLETALHSAQRGATLTKQLLSFSRMQKLDIRPVMPDLLLDNMQGMLSRTLGPLVETELNSRESRHPVSADRTQLELAILNLAINARDAMPGGGKLQISTADCTIKNDPELPPGDYVQIRVTDTGLGMTPEVAARAFEPFFTTKQLGAGTGLGLSLVYGLSKQCGGTTRIKTACDRGTTVTMFLPVAQAEADPVAEPADPASAPDKASPATVLVVDDDQDVRDFVATTLREFGHEVIASPDARSAIRIMKKQKPDLLITDYAMAGMTGADLAVAARQINSDQKIIYISGYADTDALREAAKDAVILRKPFRIGELYHVVEETLSGGVRRTG
jgi:PAS domain S-box-containing protein